MDTPVRPDDFPELADDNSAGRRPRDKPASQYRERQMVTVAIVPTPCFGVLSTLRMRRRTLAAGEIASLHHPLFRRIKCSFAQGRLSPGPSKAEVPTEKTPIEDTGCVRQAISHRGAKFRRQEDDPYCRSIALTAAHRHRILAPNAARASPLGD
jgi:hypothetical protein